MSVLFAPTFLQKCSIGLENGAPGAVLYHFIPINLNQMFKHAPNLGDIIRSDVGGIHE